MALSNLYLASGGAQLEVRKMRAQENQANRELDIRQQGANDSSRRSYLEEMASRQNIEANEFQLNLKKQEEARSKQQAALAEMVFKSNSGPRLSAEGEDDALDLSNKYLEMAKKLAPIDPVESNNYFKRAQESKSKAAEASENSLKLRGLKLKSIGDVAAGVMDTSTANAAAVELAKLGKAVPEEVLNFNNPSAKDWWARQAQFSESAVKANQLELDKKKFDSIDNDRNADNKRADTDLKLKEQKLALSREAVTKARSKLVKPDEKQLTTIINYMSEVEGFENFANASKETKKFAAGDVDSLTLKYMQDFNMSQQEARQKAAQKVNSLISENGVYTVPTETVKKEPESNFKSKFVEGKVYQDANGNKAKYSNGKWIPQ